MSPRVLYGWMERRKCLDENLTLHIPAACSTSYLGQELKCPLTRAKIRLVQGHIGINDSNQRHVGKMKTLGNHLRSQKHINFTDSKITQDAPEIVLALERIRIH